MILRFANCELDVNRVIVRRDGREVKLEPQAFDVLCYLVEHRGEVVRKEQLLDDVWGDRFVSESALTTRIKSVRQALGDDGSRQAIIRTVHGKGYEFLATVETLERPAPEDGAQVQRPPEPTLPAALQPLIGRESLLERLAAALDKHRLITLVGPGGVGKTSVGVELARRTAERYPDGVKLVELVAVGDEDATLEAVATAIDVHFRRGSSIGDAIIETLRLRRSLVVLDNCEHLVEPVASLAGRVLREAPAISIVATSREPLALPGEQVWSVDPLSTGDAGAGALAGGGLESAPAVALFVERACASDPGFELSEQNASVGRRDLPAPRRDPARDRARGGARPDDRPRGDRGAPRRAFRSAEGLPPRGRPPPPDDGGRHQLVLRPARARGAGAVQRARRLRRALRPRVGRVDVPLGRRARPAHAPRRALHGVGSPPRQRWHPLRAARDAS